MIARATPCHAAALAEIESQQPRAAGWKQQGFEAELLQPCAQIYYTQQGKELTAFLALRATHGFAEILNVAVLPRYTRQGLAFRLLTHALACLKQQRVDQVTLEVSQHNAAAVALYQKAGLRILGERKDFYGPSQHAFIMGIDL